MFSFTIRKHAMLIHRSQPSQYLQRKLDIKLMGDRGVPLFKYVRFKLGWMKLLDPLFILHAPFYYFHSILGWRRRVQWRGRIWFSSA